MPHAGDLQVNKQEKPLSSAYLRRQPGKKTIRNNVRRVKTEKSKGRC